MEKEFFDKIIDGLMQYGDSYASSFNIKVMNEIVSNEEYLRMQCFNGLYTIEYGVKNNGITFELDSDRQLNRVVVNQTVDCIGNKYKRYKYRKYDKYETSFTFRDNSCELLGTKNGVRYSGRTYNISEQESKFDQIDKVFGNNYTADIMGKMISKVYERVGEKTPNM